MVLGFMQRFPNGEPTNFKEKILSGEKIHSIRQGDRWQAGYFLHMAYGVRTNTYQQFNQGVKALEKVISTQDVFMTLLNGKLEITVDDCYLTQLGIESLIKNDGVTRKQFIDWFFPKKAEVYSGQIIHWTGLKYTHRSPHPPLQHP